jgi:hypothetical protein
MPACIRPLVPPLSRRILSRLETAEAEEPDPWLRDDLVIARLTVLHAARGDAVSCAPQVLATYEVLGLHPDKVWPAIQARRNALGWYEFSYAPPKKPAQSVKLWTENTNGARAVNSRATEQMVLRGPRLLPMATASIAAIYPNSDAPSSAKKGEFTLEEMKVLVGRSYAPDLARIVTLAALEARGEWPNQKGPASTVLSVALIGIQIESCNAPRRTTQYRIRRACDLGYWRKLREANSWTECPTCSSKRRIGKCAKCGYRGRVKDDDGKYTGEFTRPAVYELNLEEFRKAQPRCRGINFRTYAEYKESAKRGEHPNLEVMPRKPAQPAPDPQLPPATTAPVPERAKPAAEVIDRQHSRRITRDEKAALFNSYIALKRTGMSHDTAIAEVQRQFHSRFSPEDIDYAVKIVGPPPQPEPNVASEIRCYTCSDQRLVLNLNNGPGQKRLIPCPKCGVQSP